MRSLARVIALVGVFAACGGTSADVDAGDGAAADGATDATTGDAATGDAAADSGAGDAAASDSGPDAGPGSDGGAGVYTAYGLPGGLDRVRIAKTVGGTCFMLGLVWPSMNTGGLTLPQGWGFDYARAVQPAAACNPKYLGPISATYDATAKSGAVVWSGMGIPQTVTSVSVVLTFANPPAWCPASEPLSASNLPVQ